MEITALEKDRGDRMLECFVAVVCLFICFNNITTEASFLKVTRDQRSEGDRKKS